MKPSPASMKEAARASLILDVRKRLESASCTLESACSACGVSRAWYLRWSERFDAAGMDGLSDLPRSGRPGSVVLTEADSKALRRAYLKSNLNEKAGSMTLAARYCAKTGQLSEPVAAAILKPRSSKHLLPVEVKRVCRASSAEVARYRDPKAGQNDGMYIPGWLRMVADGSRRICPNERWVGDDGSVNVGICVPWTRGGDLCSDAFGVRLARFQLLAILDCATDMCVGWNYVMRYNDAYTAADVVYTMYKVAQLRGGMPASFVLEGGSWQAERTLSFLKSCGVEPISAKGRPNQKLIEGWFNRLWNVLTQTLPPYGQVGRFRGEMKKETDLWMRCRRGSEDPRQHFPSVNDFFKSLHGAIDYCNTEVCGPTKNYGTWIPSEAYTAQTGIFPAQELRPMPAGIRRFTLPVREVRTLSRGGMFGVRTHCPFGFPHNYAFKVREGYLFDGAAVIVSFNPDEIHQGATVELASNWHDHRAGRVLDEAAVCISPAPELVRTANFWQVNNLDPRREASALKKQDRALIGQRVAAYDGRGLVAQYTEEPSPQGVAAVSGYGFGDRQPVVLAADGGYDNDIDFAALEAAVGGRVCS